MEIIGNNKIKTFNIFEDLLYNVLINELFSIEILLLYTSMSMSTRAILSALRRIMNDPILPSFPSDNIKCVSADTADSFGEDGADDEIFLYVIHLRICIPDIFRIAIYFTLSVAWLHCHVIKKFMYF